MPPDMETDGAEVSHSSENEYDDADDADDTRPQDDDEDTAMADSNVSERADSGGEVKKKVYDSKDPMRPRRKKARRACFACQRAHLTCGDERPCTRCIKRGLADQCQDGVRKKAKYLHDAPPEALGPVLGPGYMSRPSNHRHPSSATSDGSPTGGTTFYSQPNPVHYYSSSQTPIPSLSDGLPYGSAQSPVSPTFQGHTGASPMAPNLPQQQAELPSFPPALFDPSNPALYNFNLDGFNSNYSAMEFSMLKQLSSGTAINTPPQDQSSQGNQQGGDFNFGPPVLFNGGGQFELFDTSGIGGDFLGLDQSVNGHYPQGNLQHGLPHAYAIAARPMSLQSPSTENNSPQAAGAGLDSPVATTHNSAPGSASQPHAPQPHRLKPPSSSAAAKLGPRSVLGKRQRDPSHIYESVKEAYPYVKSFHKLISFIQNRFPSQKTLSIAKSLASIRPAFISCTGTLNQADLVFMEKTFQRALFEYEEFMHQCSTPAIACRRTGEVAGVNKEFTVMTGWTKDVLLGLAPNLNVNTGMSSNGSQSGKGTGQTTPRIKTLNETAATAKASGGEEKPQPVFLAELMDDDSVVTFYQDFAQLAFNNSRGRVTRKCRLLKYRTQESVEGALGDAGGAATATATEESLQKSQNVTKQGILSSRVAEIDGEHGISKLEKDGKLECSYTWAIKRDTFDIPMLIVVNFLPCYYRTHNQLAV